MKYFAKYLPVEGEIKEGDIVWEPGVGFHPATKDGCLYKAYVGQKKFKRFLCTNDISIGDTLTNIDGSTDTVMVESDKYCLFDGNNFKVIGEISPNAVWVKEGDTFSEDQIEFSYKCPERNIWINVNPEGDWSAYETCWRVQCDNCKTFH